MKLPALRAELGGRTYYVTTLTFEQVSQYVSRIDDQLHKSPTLNHLIQRSITNNYLSIKEYILNQSEFFFNSLVLAVYDSFPEWSEIEIKFDGGSSYQIGLLDFPGMHKIFPVDGQHRVEGIKAALLDNPELRDQKISAVFIGHKNDSAGMSKTRRLFTALNRYAKPVSPGDSIALDEDDIVAITVRYLLEECDLFTGDKVVIAKQKGISSTNHDALTSIITLYQANVELFKCFYVGRHKKALNGPGLTKYLKFRPAQVEIDEFQVYTVKFWEAFKTELTYIAEFLIRTEKMQLRNSQTGGNLVYRPIGFLPLIKAAITIHLRTKKGFTEIFKKFDKVNLQLDQKPWVYVLWNPIQKKMLTNSDALTQLMLLYLYDKKLVLPAEKQKLIEGYGAKISYEGKRLEDVLKDF